MDSSQIFDDVLNHARSNLKSIDDISKNEQYLAESLLVYMTTFVQNNLSDFCYNVVKNFAARFDSRDLPKPIIVSKLHTQQLVPRQAPMPRVKSANKSFNESILKKNLTKYDKMIDIKNINERLKSQLAK